MKKPWSITTTLRNPERLRSFLIVLKQIGSSKWNLENQKKYQILLIQNRLYGYDNRQFYDGLSRDQIELIGNLSEKISFEQAKEIFNMKNYEDPAMRGRQSINPLKKFGFVTIEKGKMEITHLGRLLLKWQIPNPSTRQYPNDKNHNVKPSYCLFIAPTLHRYTINTFWMSIKYAKKRMDSLLPTLPLTNKIVDLQKI